MEESKDCNVDIDIDVLFRRRRKRRKIFGGEYLFSGEKENQRRERREIFGEDLSRILRSLGFGLETFANFWRVSVSVSKNLVSEKKFRFWFWRIWSQKKSIGFGFGKIWSRKKSRFRKIWFWKKKSQYLFLSKLLLMPSSSSLLTPPPSSLLLSSSPAILSINT